jgi:hypothetical protein
MKTNSPQDRTIKVELAGDKAEGKTLLPGGSLGPSEKQLRRFSFNVSSR